MGEGPTLPGANFGQHQHQQAVYGGAIGRGRSSRAPGGSSSRRGLGMSRAELDVPSVRQVKSALERIEAQRLRGEQQWMGGGNTSKVAPAPPTPTGSASSGPSHVGAASSGHIHRQGVSHHVIKAVQKERVDALAKSAVLSWRRPGGYFGDDAVLARNPVASLKHYAQIRRSEDTAKRQHRGSLAFEGFGVPILRPLEDREHLTNALACTHCELF